MEPLTILLIAIGATSFFAWNNSEWMHRLMFIPYVVNHRQEYYRFLSSGFVHADYMHLGFNLFVLWNFGEGLQYAFPQLFGDLWEIHFFGLFLLGVIVSEIPTYLRYRELPHYRSLGASGGVASVVFAFIVIYPTKTLYLFFIPMPAVVYAIGYLIYSSYQDKRQGDNVNHSAHFWGSVFGIVYCLVFKPDLALRFFSQLFA